MGGPPALALPPSRHRPHRAPPREFKVPGMLAAPDAPPRPAALRSLRLALVLPVLAGELMTQAGGQGALAGQIVFQGQDP